MIKLFDPRPVVKRLGLALLGMIALLAAGACAPPLAAPTPTPIASGTLSVVGFNFAESTLLVYLYAKPLAAAGYTVDAKP
ncbi:MAG TPA: hypothetical protein VF937_11220, partial [Chloroflexota bacterium]